MNITDLDWNVCRICRVTLTADPEAICSRCRKRVKKREKKIRKLNQKRLD